MNSSDRTAPAGPTASSRDLAAERDELRHGLARSRLAAVAVLLIAAVLGGSAVVAALRAQSSAIEARERLWDSLISQARAERLSGEVGGRTKALAAIRKAAAIQPTDELRNEAIAALALIDLETVERWPGFPEDSLNAVFSRSLTYYAIDYGGAIEVYDTKSRERIMREEKKSNPESIVPFRPESLLFSPDEKMLTGMYWGGFVVVWSIDEKRELWRVRIGENDPSICGLSFDAASKTLAVAVASKSVTRIYSLLDGKLLQAFETSAPCWTIALSPNGKILASANSELSVDVLETRERLFTHVLPSPPMELHWSPDGKRLAVGCYQGEVLIADIASKTVLKCQPVPAAIHGMTFSPDGKILMATAWDGRTRLWDAFQGTLHIDTREGNGRFFDPTGERIGFDRIFTELGVWKLNRSSVHRGYAAPGGVENDGFRGLDISPDGRWIVASSRSKLRRFVWDRRSGRVVHVGNEGERSSIFSADGLWLYSAVGDDLKRWPLGDREDFQLGEPELVATGIGSAFYSLSRGPEGRAWINGATGKRGFRLDLESEPPKLETVIEGLPESAGVATFTQSSDRRWGVASYWRGRTTQLWDLQEKKHIRDLDCFGGWTSFLPDGRLAVGTQRGLAIWSTSMWEEEGHFPFEAANSIASSLNFTSDGRYVSYEDTQTSVTLIDSKSLSPVAVFSNPHPARIYNHHFSDDSRFLLTSSIDRLDLWDLPELEKELGGLGLSFGEQKAPPASTIAETRFPPSNVAIFAGAILLIALVFGLYSMFYQRQLVRKFDNQYETLELTQRELLQSDKMKALGTLSAGVAHDFKNLLSVIKLSNDLIRRDAGDREDLLEEIAAIGHAVDQGDQVVKAMLGYCRLGSQESTSDAIDVPKVIEGTVALLGQQFLSGVSLSLKIESELPAVQIAPGALEQILLNLVVNASEAMNGKGKLTFVAESCSHLNGSRTVLRPDTGDSYVAVRVIDSGPGIPEERLARIFEPFFTTKSVGADKGTGLGLTTVYKIARDNNLGLEVQSEIGNGTRFNLYLPVKCPA